MQTGVEVASALQVDGTAKAIGTSIAPTFANTSVGAGVASGTVTGFGLTSYELALRAIAVAVAPEG